MKDIDRLAEDLVGGAKDLVNAILLKYTKAIILSLRELYEELREIERERDALQHRLDTVIVNLRHGVPVDDILRWYDKETPND